MLLEKSVVRYSDRTLRWLKAWLAVACVFYALCCGTAVAQPPGTSAPARTAWPSYMLELVVGVPDSGAEAVLPAGVVIVLPDARSPWTRLAGAASGSYTLPPEYDGHNIHSFPSLWTSELDGYLSQVLADTAWQEQPR